MVITGSRIARRDYTSQGPIVTVGSETIENRSNVRHRIRAEPAAAAHRRGQGASQQLRSVVGADRKLIGLGTQLNNPKTAIVFSSVFAALLPQSPPASFYIALPLIAFSIDTIWYTVVACTLSSPASRTAYLRYKTHVDRAAGGIMGALGIRLITLAR